MICSAESLVFLLKIGKQADTSMREARDFCLQLLPLLCYMPCTAVTVYYKLNNKMTLSQLQDALHAWSYLGSTAGLGMHACSKLQLAGSFLQFDIIPTTVSWVEGVLISSTVAWYRPPVLLHLPITSAPTETFS